LSYNQFLEKENATSGSFVLNETRTDTTSKTFTRSKGFAPCIGFGFGNFRKLKKRYCYYGLTFLYGLTKFSTTKIEVYKNNSTYKSEVSSNLSYLNLDFKIYLKKHMSKRIISNN
jgi:hypothetical protein